MKFGIISDSHVTKEYDPSYIDKLLKQLKTCFKQVDKIIHAGDIIEEDFLNSLQTIAPVICVAGNKDVLPNLEKFQRIVIGNYRIGVIHELPSDLESFVKEKNINILVFGHTHYPQIEGTPFNVLLINPGSPTKPSAPPPKKGFKEPLARPSVITMSIDEDNLLSTYIINLS